MDSIEMCIKKLTALMKKKYSEMLKIEKITMILRKLSKEMTTFLRICF